MCYNNRDRKKSTQTTKRKTLEVAASRAISFFYGKVTGASYLPITV
jgi:hypothetical protein